MSEIDALIQELDDFKVTMFIRFRFILESMARLAEMVNDVLPDL